MNDLSAKLIVRLPAGHTALANNQAAARKKAEQYVASLLAGLGVPGHVECSWEKQPAGVKTVELFVNDRPARLRHTTANSLGVAPAGFIAALGEDVLRNRTLLITPQLTRYAAGKAHASFRSFEEKKQERILHVLFTQGFGLQRLENFAPPENAGEAQPEAWAEACIGDLALCRLAIHAHASQIDPDGDPNDFNRLIEGAAYFVDAAFRIKGIPFPQIKGVKRDDFSEKDMAFQINDLIFPTHSIADTTVENINFIAFLTANGSFFLNRGSVNFLLDSLETAHPNLMALTRTRFTVDFIAGVLRNLATESISIRPLVRILEILIGGGQDVYVQQPEVSEAPPLSEIIHLTATEKSPAQLDTADWTELVRVNLKNAIINRALPHIEQGLTLSCFYPENPLLHKIIRFDGLGPAEQQQLRQNMHRQIAEHYLTASGKIRPIVTAAAFRKKIAELIASEFPETPVFSLQECLPRILVQYDQGIAG